MKMHSRVASVCLGATALLGLWGCQSIGSKECDEGEHKIVECVHVDDVTDKEYPHPDEGCEPGYVRSSHGSFCIGDYFEPGGRNSGEQVCIDSSLDLSRDSKTYPPKSRNQCKDGD